MISFNGITAEKSITTPEQLISQVEYLFRENAEALNYNEVVTLSNNIIRHREKYPNEILAKTYLLLANVASNKGELETAFQFTQDGLAIPTKQTKVKLYLQIKLASIFSAKKQYAQLLATAQQAINMPQEQENTKYFLFALSYRSVAYAMLNQHKNALRDLQKVETVIRQTPSFAEHIALLTILSSAYYHIADYPTALTIQLKILTLRFNLNKLANVDQTYYHLANTYYRLDRFNDAYNAYWEAKKYAEKKTTPIYVAYARQGLGLTLIQQQQYSDAEHEILAAKALFYQHNLAKPYLESIISLAQISNLTEQKNNAINLLLQAEKLSVNIELNDDYIVLYQLLAQIYKNQNNLNKAYFWQTKYSAALVRTMKPTYPKHPPSTENLVNTSKLTNASASTQTRQLAIKLAEQSELTSTFSKNYLQQQTLISILFGITLLLLSLVIFLWFKHRAKNLSNTYDAIEKPSYMVATPIHTKRLYQKSFNMARKYSYPLTLGYIAISNWQELTFKFNKKMVNEVTREVASLINSHINEFESAGLINKGEYLLLFPHQDKIEVEKTMNQLIAALKLRFFANLGEFSVTIAYSIESPTFQDIDPYIFLSRLSDSIKIA
ncbi:MAG: hypothetical protein JKY81_07765 [Colwellia sp.]|nr:hypothetical protein [Colwellia sp.]